MKMEVVLNNSLQVKFRESETYEVFTFVGDNGPRDIFAEKWNGIAFNCGLRKKLISFELQEIYKFVSLYFKKLTLSDVELAFGLYSANRLTFMVNGKQQTTVGHFQSFDNVFIGAVLKSYSDYSESQNQIKDIPNNEIKELPYNEVDGEDAYRFILKSFNKDKRMPWTANWNLAFTYMEDNKILELNNDEKQMFMDFVKADIKDEIKELKSKRKKCAYEEKMLSDKSTLKAECRKRMIKKHFENKN